MRVEQKVAERVSFTLDFGYAKRPKKTCLLLKFWQKLIYIYKDGIRGLGHFINLSVY